MAQSVRGAADALFAACTTLYAATVDSSGTPMLVCYGLPGVWQPQNILAVATDTRQPIDRPSAGTNRSRQTYAELDSMLGVYRAGSAENVQQAAAVDFYTITDALQTYFRTGSNAFLGGATVDAWVKNIDGPHLTPVTHAASGAVTGFMATGTVTVEVLVRY